jgi:hypothetical protein
MTAAMLVLEALFEADRRIRELEARLVQLGKAVPGV